MATIYRGIYLPTGISVVIKVLDQSCSNDDILVRRFEQEARIQNIVGRQHPGIVTCFEPLTVWGRPAIVLEYVPGQSLADILDDEEVFAPAEAIDIAIEVLDALAYAHQKGVVHRDIKSENLLLTPDGVVKVADFGVARAHDVSCGPRMTEARDLVGTMVFMAPEQLERPENVDHRADLYSLGVTLYELVTGELPFDGEEGYGLMKRIEHQKPERPDVHDPDLPADLVEVIMRALEKDRDQRFLSAHQMSAALQRCRRGLDDDGQRRVRRRRRSSSRRRSRPRRPSSPPSEPASFGWLQDLSHRLVPGRILIGSEGIKIGRHRQRCDIFIPDDGIEGEHVLVLPLADGDVLLIDLDSRSGTTIDEGPVFRHRLQAGDRFTLGGRWSFCFQR